MTLLRKSALLAAAVLLLTPISRAAAVPKSNPTIERIASLVTLLMSRQHYRMRPVDDEISRELFDEYIDTLDPGKIFFTADDVAGLKKYRARLDNDLVVGKLDFAFICYELLLERMRMYHDFARGKLKEGFDFSKDEEFRFDREDEGREKSVADLKELWRKKLKSDVLLFRLAERADKEKKANSGKKDEEAVKAHSSWNKPPEARVLKRIEQNLRNLEENDAISVLQFFLNSLTSIYDPHSTYLTPEDLEDFDISMSLSLVGIGARLTTEDGYVKIIDLIPGGPAERQGILKSEDRIIEVAQDGEPAVDVVDMPLKKVVRMIRGEKDTKVHLTVLDGEKGIAGIPEVVTIVRDKIELKDAEASGELKNIKGGGVKTVKGVDGREFKIGVVTLPSFYLDFDAISKGDKDAKSSSRDVAKILADFKKQGVDAVIVDIRSNSGGSLLEAIRLTGLFIKRGPVVQIRSWNGDIECKRDWNSEISYDGPLLVMTNAFSASASEIFAGAIQDYDRGLIVGDAHTHGKGSVQTVMDLDDSFERVFRMDKEVGALKLTTSQFYRVNGESTQRRGIEPDIVLPSFGDVMETGEKHLDHALPWNTIAAGEFDAWNGGVKNIAPILREKSEARVAGNKEFRNIIEDIKLFKERRDRKTVTLNEEKRWIEYQADQKLFDERDRLLKLADDKKDGGGGDDGGNAAKMEDAAVDAEIDKIVDGDAGDDNENDDPYLDECMRIIADMLSLKDFKAVTVTEEK